LLLSSTILRRNMAKPKKVEEVVEELSIADEVIGDNEKIAVLESQVSKLMAMLTARVEAEEAEKKTQLKVAPTKTFTNAPIVTDNDRLKAALEAGKKVFITKELPLDRFTIIRKRVEYKPSMCELCALDLAELNNLKPWEDADEEGRKLLASLVEEHKLQIHTRYANKFLTEDELNEAGTYLNKETNI
jgi:hypothetical protein